MVVIIKFKKLTIIEHFKWKSIRYWLCILKWKIRGAEVSTIKEDEII